MKYLIHKTLIQKQASSLFRRGGPYQKAAEKVYQLMGQIECNTPSPFNNLNVTKNGETRINHCIKYDLNAACRLVTIKDNGVHAMVFLGDHNETDKWLDANKGYTLTINGTELIGLKVTSDITEKPRSNSNGKLTEGSLIQKLEDRYLDILLRDINGKTYKRLEELNAYSSDDEILEIASSSGANGIAELVFDVFMLLKEDDIDSAKKRILLTERELTKLEDATPEEVNSIDSGEEYILLDDFSGKDIENMMNGSSWIDWMLFMHPQQRKVVNLDFNGPSRLLGVSGSGKTCVTVNRAIRLAKKYPNEKILITTINRSLAQLIENLVLAAIESEQSRNQILDCIEIMAISDVKRKLLELFETDNLTKKSLDEYTHKHSEDIDQIWKEYYLCENNNDDAKVMLELHKSLLNRNILPLQYIKEEFDWIRSALAPNERIDYLEIEREGRTEPLTKEYRQLILKGLDGWESKMSAVGGTDHLGLLKIIYNHIEEIQPIYRCILVDELQDFGTIELRIIRKLVAPNENDLFLCGDIAQRVFTKQHKITKAGITILPQNYKKITKNYRNSKQILEAAAHIFNSNVNPEDFNSSEFELLNPQFANFSTPKPFLRSANNFYDELDFSIKYLNENLQKSEKACIAICGYTFYQVQSLAKRLDMCILDGVQDLSNGNIFFSDLNQTKGFEFDRVIIINCGKNVFPNSKIPQKEWFREFSKLYVSMTRAKKELIISYSSGRSEIFEKSLELINTDTQWDEYVFDNSTMNLDKIQTKFEIQDYELRKQTGHDFLYSELALGLSTASQDKLLSLVKGTKSSNAKGNADEWRNMSDFINDLNNTRLTPHITGLLGPNVTKELKEKFEGIKK